MSNNDKKTVFITKEDGVKEEFLPEKLKTSLIKSGANPNIAEKIVDSIVEEIATEGSIDHPVVDIYHKAFAHLKKLSVSAAARYSLRRSLFELGPTGFPFEKYVAEIFKAKGYETMTDQVIFGGCVPYEVDMVAWDKSKLIMAEVKYHHEPSGKTDLKVALYVKARYDDIKQNMYDYGMPKGNDIKQSRKLDEGWLITNTKFTETALTYGNCVGTKMLSWNEPLTGNLHDLISETKLHPVTCLTTLNAAEKKDLLDANIVLCKSIYQNTQILKDKGYTPEKIFKIMEEISGILESNVPAN